MFSFNLFGTSNPFRRFLDTVIPSFSFLRFLIFCSLILNSGGGKNHSTVTDFAKFLG